MPSLVAQQQVTSPQAPAPASAEEKAVGAETVSLEQQLLAGQPPGTVIKCVTAQVIQTPQGPRIVLQGLQGAEFTQQQLAVVQQQVKQQLLKGIISMHHFVMQRKVQLSLCFKYYTVKMYPLLN